MTEQRRRRDIDDVDVDPDEALAASEFGTTEHEQVAGVPLDDKLAAERPDQPPGEDAPPGEDRLGDEAPDGGEERS